MTHLSRRGFIKNSLVAAAGIPILSQAQIDARSSKQRRSLRVAHISDVHISDNPTAVRGVENMFRSINSLKDKPNFILNTGDTVLEANLRSEEYVANCWKSWKASQSATNKLKIYSAIGNHDNWYVAESDAKSYQNHPDYRKNWAIKALEMPARYYHFSEKDWHFFVLDSIADRGYELGDRQLHWLSAQLASLNITSNVCILSHVPIFSVTAMMAMMQNRKSSDEYVFPFQEQHRDSLKLKELFSKYPNVKLCLSGHTHMADEINLLGVKYLGNGAVSGNWWAGDLNQFPPMYAVLDFYEDGTTECSLVKYDWK